MSRRTVTVLSLLLALIMCLGALPVSADGSSPVAKNFEFETYRGISFGGQLSAIDPDGDVLSYEITTQPAKGSIALEEDGSFVYSPEEGRKGKDYFGYRAIDSEGNCSQEATVIIRLIKQKTDVSYSDMENCASYYSAIALAECGAFVGKQVGGEYYFEPQAYVSRGEFIDLCLAVTGVDLLNGVVSTGFTDDCDIPVWQKSSISTAVKCGIVKGYSDVNGAYLDADSEITRAEAMVMLDRVIRTQNVSYMEVDSSVPDFAVQAAANLSACNVISSTQRAASPLTRAEAADMITAAMALLSER